VSPWDDFTPAEMHWMREARQMEKWDHTSCILAMVHNSVSKRAKKPIDFNPMAPKKQKRSKGVKLSDFKPLLTNTQKRR